MTLQWDLTQIQLSVWRQRACQHQFLQFFKSHVPPRNWENEETRESGRCYAVKNRLPHQPYQLPTDNSIGRDVNMTECHDDQPLHSFIIQDKDTEWWWEMRWCCLLSWPWCWCGFLTLGSVICHGGYQLPVSQFEGTAPVGLLGRSDDQGLFIPELSPDYGLSSSLWSVVRQSSQSPVQHYPGILITHYTLIKHTTLNGFAAHNHRYHHNHHHWLVISFRLGMTTTHWLLTCCSTWVGVGRPAKKTKHWTVQSIDVLSL